MNVRDFAIGQVATAPSPATSGTTLTLDSGQGGDMPDTPFMALANSGTALPTKYNSELLEVTDVTGDTLTIVRAQGDTSARSIAVDWLITNPILTKDVLSIVASDTEPSSPEEGDLWVDTSG